MVECELCQQGDPAITVRCHNCRKHLHLHQSQVDKAPDNSLVMAKCPECGVINCWEKVKGKVRRSGPVAYWGQPVVDLRRKR